MLLVMYVACEVSSSVVSGLASVMYVACDVCCL